MTEMQTNLTDEAIVRLLDAAEAVLDSECGVQSLAELAEALVAVAPTRDYRDLYPSASDVA